MNDLCQKTITTNSSYKHITNKLQIMSNIFVVLT